MSFLVLGEAPESDEETKGENQPLPCFKDECSNLESTVMGSAVVGEAIESDEEVEIHSTPAVPATPVDASGSRLGKFFNDTSKIQSVSLKKLREKNRLLYESITSFRRQILTSTNFELSNINQQLLKSQIELQQTLNHTRQVKNNLQEFQKRLNDIVVADYIPKINIKVPTNII